MEKQMLWKNRDFYLSCVVRAYGFPLVGIEKTEHNFVKFILEVSPQKAEEIISLHWQKKLSLPTKDLIEAINELKTRLKSGV